MHITQVATVFIPVTDHDRALAFYVQTLGLEKVADFEYAGGERWAEVLAPGAATRISLVSARDGWPAGIETRVVLASDDVDGDRALLEAQGADVDAAIQHEDDPPVQWGGAVLAGIPAMFGVRDPDANSLLIVQNG